MFILPYRHYSTTEEFRFEFVSDSMPMALLQTVLCLLNQKINFMQLYGQNYLTNKNTPND